jgi:signal transduction histidine kinase
MESPDRTEESPASAEERERAAELRSAYLGFAAHEIRNPLSTALWTAELLARMTPEERAGSRGSKLSAMCVRSLSRVRQLIEDHFLIERLDAGGQPLRPEPVQVREALEALRARGLEPSEEAVEVDATVVADRAIVERVLEAMLGAALGAGAVARIEARTEGDRLLVRVDGEPAAPDALADPAKGAPSDQRGRALALPAARRAAAALGGALSIEGGGYVLTLPRAGVYPAPPKPQPPPRR